MQSSVQDIPIKDQDRVFGQAELDLLKALEDEIARLKLEHAEEILANEIIREAVQKMASVQQRTA